MKPALALAAIALTLALLYVQLTGADQTPVAEVVPGELRSATPTPTLR